MVFKHSHLKFQQRCLVGQLAPCIFLVCYTAEREKTKHFKYYDIYSSINTLGPRKFIPPPWYKGGGGQRWMDPPRVFDMLQYFETILLPWKAFDLLYKMRYILWVVALLGTCDVANNGRHLGFYQELEIRLKPREMVIFCA